MYHFQWELLPAIQSCSPLSKRFHCYKYLFLVVMVSQEGPLITRTVEEMLPHVLSAEIFIETCSGTACFIGLDKLD